MSKKRSFRKKVSVGNSTRNPAQPIRWNSQRGAWSFSSGRKGDPDFKLGNYRNIHGVILDPALYRVTGQDNQKRRVWSNLCYSDRHDHLKVTFKNGTEPDSKPKVIFEGTYGELKSVKNNFPKSIPDCKFTRVIFVTLLKGEVSFYEEGRQREWEKFDYTENLEEAPMVMLYLHGWAINKGYGKSVEEYNTEAFLANPQHEPVDALNTDTMYFAQISEKNYRSDDDKWWYPYFKLTNLPIDHGDKKKAKLAQAIADKSREHFEELDSFLDKLYADSDRQNAADIEAGEDKEPYADDEDEMDAYTAIGQTSTAKGVKKTNSNDTLF
jgi:hypothetical protein